MILICHQYGKIKPTKTASRHDWGRMWNEAVNSLTLEQWVVPLVVCGHWSVTMSDTGFTLTTVHMHHSDSRFSRQVSNYECIFRHKSIHIDITVAFTKFTLLFDLGAYSANAMVLQNTMVSLWLWLDDYDMSTINCNTVIMFMSHMVAG